MEDEGKSRLGVLILGIGIAMLLFGVPTIYYQQLQAEQYFDKPLPTIRVIFWSFLTIAMILVACGGYIFHRQRQNS